MKPLKRSLWPVFENILPWATLALITWYAIAYFVDRPYTGFEVTLTDQGWKVLAVNPGNVLRVDDLLTRVAGVPSSEAQQDLTRSFFNTIHNGETVEIELVRQGRPLVLTYKLPGFNAEEFFNRLGSQWFVPYIFWLAGCAALLFLRPRGTLRRLLALFCFLNAGWISTGALSAPHMLGAALALRSLIFLVVPVFLHLHWLFPSPLRPLPAWAWSLLYGVFIALAVAAWFQLLPQNFFLAPFILAIAGSLVLLVVHVIRQPSERRALRGMVTALGMVLLPVVVIMVLAFINFDSRFAQISILGLVALPGFYFYTLYIRQLTPGQSRRASHLVRSYFFLIGVSLLFCLAFSAYVRLVVGSTAFTNYTLVVPLILGVVTLLSFLPFVALPALADERITLALGPGSFGFSANRAGVGAIFLVGQVLAGLTVYNLLRLANFRGSEILAVLAALLACGLLGVLGYSRFQHFFERRVLGMPLAPEGLLKTYTARISTSLALEPLRALLLDEVMPSLLVRRFAQLEWRSGSLTCQFSLRAGPAELPGDEAQPALERSAGQVIASHSAAGLPGWIRLVLPLRAAGQTRGYWLLGQRDPDDRYYPDEVATLQALADQTALALVNIEQSAALRSLYFADMERHEAERLHLAAELHDDVLHQLALLSLNLPDDAPAAQEAYDQAVLHIREMINGLRPAMLNYGLFPALRALVDELNDRQPSEGPCLSLELPAPAGDPRYPDRVELALFRVTQQACANAIQHAACRQISIQGSLGENCAELVILDDGQGFPGADAPDLPALLAARHFGLAGMLERAALIGADLRFHSTPGRGTLVRMRWQSKEP